MCRKSKRMEPTEPPAELVERNAQCISARCILVIPESSEEAPATALATYMPMCSGPWKHLTKPTSNMIQRERVDPSLLGELHLYSGIHTEGQTASSWWFGSNLDRALSMRDILFRSA